MSRRRRFLFATLGVLLAATIFFAFIVWQSGLLRYYLTIRAAKMRHPPVTYAGDGEFFDTGTEAGIDRFVVDFGEIDLTSEGSYSFELSGLPVAHFVAYLRVSTPLVYNDSDLPQTGWGLTTARLQLYDADKVIFDVSGALNEWTWSGPVGSNSSMLYILDGGFDASPNTTFRLVVTISNVATDAPATRLVITGGGWQDYMTNQLHGLTWE